MTDATESEEAKKNEKKKKVKEITNEEVPYFTEKISGV